MPAKARVEFRPEFRSAASSPAWAACEVRLALRPSGGAQAIDITRVIAGTMPSYGALFGEPRIGELSIEYGESSEKDTQAFENMESSTKWRPQKLASWDKNGPQTSPNLALLPKEDVLAVFC